MKNGTIFFLFKQENYSNFLKNKIAFLFRKQNLSKFLFFL